MPSRKSYLFARAVLLGVVTVLMGNPAWAAVNLDADTSDATFARETLSTQVDRHAGYYVVRGIGSDKNITTTIAGNELNVIAKVGVGVAGERVLYVDYTLDGMVFNETPDLIVVGAGTEDKPTSCSDTAVVKANASRLRAGGDKGDTTASFALTAPMAGIDKNAKVCLLIPSLGISANASGGVSMMVQDDLSRPLTHTASFSGGAVSAMKALAPSGQNKDPVALVSTGFKSFASQEDGNTGPAQEATVGNVMVGANHMLLDAVTGDPIGKDAAAGLAFLIAAGADDEANAGGDAVTSVVFMGDFSFTNMVWLQNASPCTRATSVTSIMLGKEEEMRGERTQAQTLAYVNANSYLCIGVAAADSDDAVEIPETAPYMAMKTFVAAGEFASAPPFIPTTVDHPLGRITRNGTTVRIPYVTTYAPYNQRIVIRNRGGEAAYKFTFHTEDEIIATEGASAEGMLAGNSTTYISVQHHDLVTFEGRFHRASATLSVVSQPNLIDVSVVQINEGGGTDTVVLTDTDR